jgi:hypothetical protein
MHIGWTIFSLLSKLSNRSHVNILLVIEVSLYTYGCIGDMITTSILLFFLEHAQWHVFY